MTRNGHPNIQIMELPLCLVCEKGIFPGEKVVVAMPEVLFIHLYCVKDEDEAREIIRQHKESGEE